MTPQKYLEECYDSKYSTEMNLLINEDIVKTFMPYLNPHEKIIWTAKPSQGLVFNPSDIPTMLFAVVWLLMSTNMATSFFDSPNTSNTSPLDLGFFIMPILFVGIGVYMLFGHFFVDMLRRSKIVYAMSDTRIFIRSGFFSKDLDILTIKNIDTLKLKEDSQGNGTIELDKMPKQTLFQKRNLIAELSGYYPIPRIEHIEKVREVYQLISQFQAGSDIHNMEVNNER